jgi:hypothetical protein
MEVCARRRRIAELQRPLFGQRSARQSRARAGRDASLRRSASPTALRCSVPWPRRQLTARTAFAPFRQSRRSQSTRRATRAAHGPCAPRRLRGASRPARARLCGGARGVRPKTKPATTSRQAAPGRGDFCGDEEHSAGVGARSALRALTCRRLFERSERTSRSEFCGTTPARAPQCSRRSRPPQHEPLSGAAWRDALHYAVQRTLAD